MRFDRAASGALSNSSCVEDPPLSAGCGAVAQGLNGAIGVAVSPDAASVYAVGAGDRAIVRFDRALTPPSSPAPRPRSPSPTDHAPDTHDHREPKAKTKKKQATFEFTGTDARAVASFECSLNGAPFTSCTSPLTVKGKKGKNSFAVRAKDAAGNVDPTPATFDWKVKKKKKK